jgi:hypothetical protein
MSDQPQPNVANSLLVIHMVVTRGLAVAIENTTKFSASGFPDETTRRGFASYLLALEQVLSSHHMTEDELAFPYFEKIISDMPYEMLSTQHQEMLPFLAQIKDASETFKAGSGEATTFEQLKSALGAINSIWHPHIGIEEQHLSPARLAGLINVDEHLRLITQMGEYSQQHSAPPFLVIPFILYNLPPGPRMAMQKALPPEIINNLVPNVWKDQWAPMKLFLLE